MISLEEYRQELLEELRADASIGATDVADEFINRALMFLDDNGELPEPTQLYFGKRGRGNRMMQIDGYAFDNADSSLCLIIGDFQDTTTPENLIQTQIKTLSNRLSSFLDEACNGQLNLYCDDSDEILTLAGMLKSRFQDKTSPILKIKYFIITNKSLSTRVTRLKEGTFNELPVELHIWSIERFYEAKCANSSEPIRIDFEKDFQSGGIPCIRGEIGENLGYEAFIAIMPGKLLAQLYIEYGSRLLEGNVRAFLGASGSKSVNAGIRKTINTDPTKFFTYNNGIATTASDVTTEIRNGSLYITGIEDMQIINGGQTTASLAAAVLKKENTELAGIFVPMKLTVISDRESKDKDGTPYYDLMVQNISRFANSQNKVTAADFFSNNPFHIRLEQLSRKHLAPPANGMPFPTGWYYERSRGKYSQEMVGMTKAERDRFQDKFPKKQVITKEKLAKCLNALNMHPDEVSKGANKNMVLFANWITAEFQRKPSMINDFFFKRCVCAIIIFDGVDNLVKKAPWYQAGGYKLNIVPYTIAKLMSLIPKGKSINWQALWQRQGLDPAFIDQADLIAQLANSFICDSHGMIVTEYCKKADTWEAFKKVPCELLTAFAATLIDEGENADEERRAVKEQQEIKKVSDEIMVVELGSKYWQDLLDSKIAAPELNYRDRSFLELASLIDISGRLPTAAQARVILGIRQKLIDKGIISE